MSKITLEELRVQAVQDIFCSFLRYCPKAETTKSLVTVMNLFEAKVLSMIADVYLKKEGIELGDDEIIELARTCKEMIRKAKISTCNERITDIARAIVTYSKDFMAVGMRNDPSIDPSVKLLAGYVISFAIDTTNAIKMVFTDKEQQDNFAQLVYVEVMEKIYKHYSQELLPTKRTIDTARAVA